jgi:hypothetical protein
MWLWVRRQTPIAKRSDPRYGHVKGQPVRFINGHNGRNFSAETRAQISDTAKIRWADPAEPERQSATVTDRFKDPAERIKQSEKLKRDGHRPPPGSGCGSNGVPAPMEARLLAAMPADWLLHHRLDRGIGGGATSLVVIDLSLLAARVAVEIDGRSHCLTAQKARDREKEEFLLARGFRVIRVSNEQVRTSLEPTVAFHHRGSRPPGRRPDCEVPWAPA